MFSLNRRYRLRASILAFLAFSTLKLQAVNWLPFGPDGGDARAFASDPGDHMHLYLGTATGWVYESHDGGDSWKRLAAVGGRDDLALDSIIVDASDSKHMLIGAWVLGSADGGLFVSRDSGVSWHSVADMRGQSIRALSAAPSDPKILVAGTLKGVYRSEDGGEHWQLISPAGSQELHEIESIAIDPSNPQIIYAGTWHLPWKTTDGGQHWFNIKQGVAEDSDVFSIIVDPKDPKVVYASACSGIYKSQNAGGVFQRVTVQQGFPSTAHRTRVLMQDPKNQNIVFAGTTEGLYRTMDSGTTWTRRTGADVIVNDVYVDPSNTNHVLLATDRGGVMESNDGATSFHLSNTGFSVRQITAYLTDVAKPTTLYVGVVNDKTYGGVFVSENGGLTWTQKSEGLNGADIFSLGQSADGTVLAGTAHGLYRLQGELWQRVNDVSLLDVEYTAPRVVKKGASGRTTTVKSPAKPPAKAQPPFDGGVRAFSRSGNTLYAATTHGLLRSETGGASWKLVNGLPMQYWNYTAASSSTVVVAALDSAMISTDGGLSWTTMKMPDTLKQIAAITVDGTGGIWVGGREGVFVSEDKGTSWHTLKDLFIPYVNSLYYDASSQRVLITSDSKDKIAFAVHLPDRKVRYWNTGWTLRMLRPVGDHLVGATLFDGIVVQPEMVDSSKVGSQVSEAK